MTSYFDRGDNLVALGRSTVPMTFFCVNEEVVSNISNILINNG